jgi:hypothetical protein
MHIAQNWRLKGQRYRLMGVKCESCGNVMFPPREICPQCREAELKAKIAEKIEVLTFQPSVESRAAR